MEIQTFFLAEQVSRLADDRDDVRRAAISHLVCGPGAVFPFLFKAASLMLLRRETTSGNTPFTLRYTLVDEDGKQTGQPSGQTYQCVFPDGQRFYKVLNLIEFIFPGLDRYRLDITLDEGLAGAVYTYDFDLVPGKVPAAAARKGKRKR